MLAHFHVAPWPGVVVARTPRYIITTLNQFPSRARMVARARRGARELTRLRVTGGMP